MEKTNSTINVRNEVEYITYPNLEKLDFIVHATSTRAGGVSTLPYTKSMNLGFKTDDSFETVKENYQIFCSAVGFTYKNLTHANQTHSSNILTVGEKDVGKGLFKERDYENIDALITNLKNVPLAILTADCVPVLFCDTKNKVIGAAHCGWRGTFDKLQEKVVKKMAAQFNTNPEDVYVAVCPSVHSCCYEVSKDLAERFKLEFPFLDKEIILQDSSYYLDLPEINRSILVKTGIPDKNIFVSDICTACNNEKLFSHRITGFKRGMIATIIELK